MHPNMLWTPGCGQISMQQKKQPVAWFTVLSIKLDNVLGWPKKLYQQEAG